MTTSIDTTTILSEVGDHELSVLVFYRGHWCPFCQSYLRELNGEFRTQLQAIGGRMIGITSQSPELAAEAKQAWALDYDVISDPSNALAQRFDINITAKTETPMADHPTEYPNGMSQTGVIVLDRSGEVIYNWAVDPTETNLHGASDRPLPADVWAAIEAHRGGTEPEPTDGRRLDPQFLADNYPEQFAAFEAWIASQNA
ncbi:MAG: peroxiredoxin-like family protein [Acidimicrobiales bacterium]